MTDSIHLLISLLNYINTDETIDVLGEHYSSTHPLVNAAKYLANEYLIGEDGHPDRINIDIVGKNGFLIFPGELDKFGWITGQIKLSRGIIMFG